MKSKQLANVLIKILGLSICLYAIPVCVTGIIVWSSLLPPGETSSNRILSSTIGAAVQAFVGIIIIAMSRIISGFWFKNEVE
jgi:cytochrome b subunit of formate dehydrogenase